MHEGVNQHRACPIGMDDMFEMPLADNFALHEELGKEYERQHRIREERGGKTLRHLVAIANRPRYGRRRIPRRSR